MNYTTLMITVSTDLPEAELLQMVRNAVSNEQDKTSDGDGSPPLVEAFAAEDGCFADVLAFHRKFQVPEPEVPSFLNLEAFNFRRKFMHEELSEFEEAHAERDMLKAADALVDLVYVTCGTAIMMGLPWAPLWAAVQFKNMLKERAAPDGSDSKRGTKLDVVKPAGWTPPDHSGALGKGPWPTFIPVGAEGNELLEAPRLQP